MLPWHLAYSALIINRLREDLLAAVYVCTGERLAVRAVVGIPNFAS